MHNGMRRQRASERACPDEHKASARPHVCYSSSCKIRPLAAGPPRFLWEPTRAMRRIEQSDRSRNQEASMSFEFKMRMRRTETNNGCVLVMILFIAIDSARYRFDSCW